MSEKTKFWLLLTMLVLSIALAAWLNSSYNRIIPSYSLRLRRCFLHVRSPANDWEYAVLRQLSKPYMDDHSAVRPLAQPSRYALDRILSNIVIIGCENVLLDKELFKRLHAVLFIEDQASFFIFPIVGTAVGQGSGIGGEQYGVSE